MKDLDMQLIWEKYSTNEINENMYDDTIYRVDLYTGNSEMLLMDPEIEKDLATLDKREGGATVWMAEEYLYLQPRKYK